MNLFNKLFRRESQAVTSDAGVTNTDKVEVPAEEELITELKLYLNGFNGYLSWSCPYHGGSIIVPWKEFYKWYFSRTNHSFIMKYQHAGHPGNTMIRRKDIIRFEVTIKSNRKQLKLKK